MANEQIAKLQSAVRNLQSMVDDLTAQQLVQQALFMAIGAASTDREAIRRSFELYAAASMEVAKRLPTPALQAFQDALDSARAALAPKEVPVDTGPATLQ